MAIQTERFVNQRKRKRQPDSDTLIRRSLYHTDGTLILKSYRELSQTVVSTESMLGPIAEISVAGVIHRASNKAQRSLVRPISPQHLSHVESSKEFKYIFLQFVRCHRIVHVKMGGLHDDLSLNNLVFTRDEESTPSGILNDWDLAKPVSADEIYRMSTARHRTGMAPFMALDLLDEDPPSHLYRHDLESFLYILIWCAIHFSLNGSRAPRVNNAVDHWVYGTWDAIGNEKDRLFSTKATKYRKSIYAAITPAFRPIQRWVQGLIFMFDDGNQVQRERTNKLERLELEGELAAPDAWSKDTLNGTVTYEKFMAAIGEDPRILELDGSA